LGGAGSPRERQFDISRHDSTLTIGDPLATGMLSKKWGQLHVSFADLVNISVRDYRNAAIANLSLNRWMVGVSRTATWHSAMAGWDISGNRLSFNGTKYIIPITIGNDFGAKGKVSIRNEKDPSALLPTGHPRLGRRSLIDSVGRPASSQMKSVTERAAALTPDSCTAESAAAPSLLE
jgi:hypothetical protein